MSKSLVPSSQPVASTRSQSTTGFQPVLPCLGWSALSPFPNTTLQGPASAQQPAQPPAQQPNNVGIVASSDITRILVNDALGTTQTLSDMNLPLNVDRIIDVAPASNAFGRGSVFITLCDCIADGSKPLHPVLCSRKSVSHAFAPFVVIHKD